MPSGGIPSEAITFYKQAMDHLSNGDYEFALKNLKDAVVIAPGFSAALYEMGRCYERLGQYPEALSVVDEVLQINQTHNAEMSRKRILDKILQIGNHDHHRLTGPVIHAFPRGRVHVFHYVGYVIDRSGLVFFELADLT